MLSSIAFSHDSLLHTCLTSGTLHRLLGRTRHTLSSTKHILVHQLLSQHDQQYREETGSFDENGHLNLLRITLVLRCLNFPNTHVLSLALSLQIVASAMLQTQYTIGKAVWRVALYVVREALNRQSSNNSRPSNARSICAGSISNLRWSACAISRFRVHKKVPPFLLIVVKS